MKTINVNVNAGTGALTFYVPAPCRGIVVGLKAVFSAAVAAGDTVDIQKNTTSVNLITVATADIAAGVVSTGVRDATNKNLIFDPNSATVTDQVLKIVISALESANTLTNIEITFDDFALTDQS
jgi:hypothetical protein